ncbi:hypothetical protein C1I97_07510 [Streptomyces sp. NTH33]|nr:hypothetical protein C1I97_07510 [Streptomyces sp. NTH33]
MAMGVATAGVIVGVLRGGGDGSPAAEQSAFCWGALKRGDVAALSVHPLQRYASDEGNLKGSTRADCQVGAGLDAHGVMKQTQFRLSVGGAPVNTVWYMADDVAGVSLVRAPIAGVPGWINRSMAGVLLPASCTGKLQFGNPVYVRLQVEDDQDETWRDGTLQKRMTDVLMTAATGLTRQLGCSETTFASPDTAPRLLEEHAPAAGKACGLPGFTAPVRFSKEYVTEGDFRLWSCSLGTGADAVHFTVTQDPYLVFLNTTGSAHRHAVLTCGGKRTLVQTDTQDTDLARSFRTAVAHRANCA